MDRLRAHGKTLALVGVICGVWTATAAADPAFVYTENTAVAALNDGSYPTGLTGIDVDLLQRNNGAANDRMSLVLAKCDDAGHASDLRLDTGNFGPLTVDPLLQSATATATGATSRKALWACGANEPQFTSQDAPGVTVSVKWGAGSPSPLLGIGPPTLFKTCLTGTEDAGVKINAPATVTITGLPAEFGRSTLSYVVPAANSYFTTSAALGLAVGC